MRSGIFGPCDFFSRRDTQQEQKTPSGQSEKFMFFRTSWLNFCLFFSPVVPELFCSIFLVPDCLELYMRDFVLPCSRKFFFRWTPQFPILHCCFSSSREFQDLRKLPPETCCLLQVPNTLPRDPKRLQLGTLPYATLKTGSRPTWNLVHFTIETCPGTLFLIPQKLRCGNTRKYIARTPGNALWGCPENAPGTSSHAAGPRKKVLETLRNTLRGLPETVWKSRRKPFTSCYNGINF